MGFQILYNIYVYHSDITVKDAQIEMQIIKIIWFKQPCIYIKNWIYFFLHINKQYCILLSKVSYDNKTKEIKTKHLYTCLHDCQLWITLVNGKGTINITCSLFLFGNFLKFLNLDLSLWVLIFKSNTL